NWFTLAILAFGITNVLFDPPGTVVIRTIAIAAAFAALLWPQNLRVFMLLVAWLVWPPAFMVSWALARESRVAATEGHEGRVASMKAKTALAALIGSVAIASAAYRAIVGGVLQQTAALFIGIPAILAIVVVFAVSPRTATGVACKAVTVGLLVSLLFLGEGF